MQKKKRTQLLLLAVVLIYGAIIIRFFILTGDENEVIVSEIGVEKDFSPKEYATQKEFTISTNYRDPFLGKFPKTKKVISTKVEVVKKTPFNESVLVPQIVYQGIVSAVNASKKVYALLIDGRSFVLSEGEAVGDITVISGNETAITVKHLDKKIEIQLTK